MLLEPGSDDAGRFFKEYAVGGGEGGRGVAIDVDFANDFALRVDGDNDLGFGLDGAGEIERIGVHVVYDNRLAQSDSGAADALGDGNANVGGWLAGEVAKDQGLGIGGVEHIKAGPVAVRELIGNGLDDGFLEGIERRRSGGKLAHAGKQRGHLRGEAESGHVQSVARGSCDGCSAGPDGKLNLERTAERNR